MQIARLMVSVGGDISDALSSLSELDKKVAETGSKSGSLAGLATALTGVASAAVAAAAAVAALAVGLAAAVGGAALAAWKGLDDAADSLTLSVGATGQALDQMTSSVTSIYTSTAGLGSSMGEIAGRMGELRQVTGAAGMDLENLTAQLSRAAQVGPQAAVGAADFGRVLQGWQIPAAQGSALLDQMYASSQKFGLSVAEQAQAVTQFGGALRQMGLSLDQSLGLLAQANAAGVNVEKMLTGLSTAAGKFAKDGIEMSHGLEQAFATIKNAESPIKAAQVAVETFGQKAGPQLADAIRSGAVSLAGLQKALGDTEGALQKATEATMDFPEKLALIGKQAQMALAPAGTAIANSLGKALDQAKPLIDSLISSIAGMATKIGPVIEQIASGLISGLEPVANAFAILGPPVEQLMVDVANLANTIMQAIAPGVDFGQVWQEAVNMATAALQTFLALMDSLVNGAAAQAGPVMDGVRTVLSGIGDAVGFMLPGLQAFLGSLMELGGNIGQLVMSALGGIGSLLAQVDWEPIRRAAIATWDTLVLTFTDIVRYAGVFVNALNVTLQNGPQAGWNAFMAGNAQIAADHDAKMTAIEAHLTMSMVNQQSIWATGMAGSGQVVAGGLNNILDMYSAALAKTQAMQLGMQLGRAGGNGYNYSMGAMGEPKTPAPVTSNYAPVVSSLNKMAGGYGDIGKAATGAGKAAGEAKKSAEEMAKQSADALKSILDAVEKMKEFLDKGYAALVEGDAAGKLTALSDNLFALGRTFTDQLAAASKGLSEEAVKAAQLGSQGISSAASALKSMVDLLPKMWEFNKTPAWAAVQSSPALFTSMSAVLIDMGRVFYEQMAAASAGVEENAVKASQLLATGIQAAGSAISAVISAVKAMWEMYASGLWDEVQANRALLLQMSQWLIDLGRDIFDQFAAAAGGVQEDSVKAAQLLSTGIQAATSAISATLKLVVEMLDVAFSWAFLDAIGGRLRGHMLAVAQALTLFGRDVFEAFASAGAGVKEKTVAAAQRLSEGIKAAADGLKSALDSVNTLLAVATNNALITAIGGATGGGTDMSRWVLGVAAILADFARVLVEEWGRVGNALSAGAVGGSKALADGAEATSKGLAAVVSALNTLIGGLRTLMQTAAQFSSAASLTRITEWYANVALIITDEWGRVGNALAAGAVGGAKALSDGTDALSKGVSALVTTLTVFLDGLSTLIAAAAEFPTTESLTTITAWYANVALIIVNEWGRIGNALASGAVAGAVALADGIEAVSRGVSALVTTLTTFLDGLAVLFATAAAFPTGDSLRTITEWYANIALIIVNEWGRVGGALERDAVAGAKALSDGITSAASGVKGVVDALTVFVDSQKLLASLPAGGDWVRGLTEWFANIALIMVNEWGRIGAALEKGAVDGAKQLADGASSVASGLSNIMDALTKLAEWVKKPLTLTPQMQAAAGQLATDFTTLWYAIEAALAKVAAPTKEQEAVVKAWTSVSDFTGQALGMMDSITKLADWLKKPVTLTQPMKDAAAVLAVEWTALWVTIANALAKIAPPDMDKDALVKAWAGVADFSSQALSMIDTLPKLADWLKKPVTLTSEMMTAAAQLAVEWTRLWTAIKVALDGIAPPAEAADANVKAWTGVADFTSQALGMIDVLPKLSDWLKKPTEYTSEMGTAAGHLAAIWTALWKKIKIALDGIVPPAEAEDANVKAWAGVSDFTGQALSVMDTLPKLLEWLKKPVEYTSEMGTAAGHLAVVWTALWKKIKIALDGIIPPTEDEQANVKAWAAVADFSSQALGMMDALPKLAEWLKKPTEYTSAMGTAAGHLAAVWTALWKSIKIALDGIVPPTEDEQANTKAWAGVSDFSSQALGMMDSIVKLSEWLKKPAEYTDAMGTAAATLAVDWTRLWEAIRAALASITPPTEDEQANVKAWAGVADFTGQALGMMDSIVKLGDWLKKPSEYTDAMGTAAATLATDWTRLWWAIQGALKSIVPPTEAEEANVKAWSGVADFTSQATGLMDTLVKLRDWVKKPTDLTTEMQAAAAKLAQEWTALWWSIQGVLKSITPPTEAQEANVKAWAGVSDFSSQALGMMDSITKLDEWLKKPLTLTPAMKTAAAQLAVEFTDLWKTIADALNGITAPTDVQEAAVKAWASVSDAFSIVSNTLDLIKKLVEFNIQKMVGDQTITTYAIPTTAQVKPLLDAAILHAVAFLKAIVTAAESSDLKSSLDKAAQDATKALNDVASNAFSVINGVLGTLKSLFEFKVENGPGMVNAGQGNYIWTSGSSTPGIPGAGDVTAKVTQLMDALKAIVEAVRTGVSNVSLGEDPAALQTKLAQIEGVLSSAANIVAKAQQVMGGGNGNIALAIHIAAVFDIPDLAAAIANLTVPTIHIPVVFDLPDGTTIGGSGTSGSGTTNGSASPGGTSGSGTTINNVNVHLATAAGLPGTLSLMTNIAR